MERHEVLAMMTALKLAGTRDVWDGEDAIDAVHESFRILA